MKRYDDDDTRSKLMQTAGIMGVLVLVILGMVLYANRSKDDKPKKTINQPPNIETAGGEESTGQITDSRTSDDLDIWDEDYTVVLEQSITPTQTPEVMVDETNDGKHTQIRYEDGSSEWVSIVSSLKKNAYDSSAFQLRFPLMQYYEDGVKISYNGAVISQDQNYVNYIALKKAGIDFVMLRVGYRGFADGEIVPDKNFGQNLKDATDAGLSVGICFYSEAVNSAEAEEEAEFVLEHIKGYDIDYPIVFVANNVRGETDRSENLAKSLRTQIALAFIDKIREAGYLGMVGANKEYLILKFDLSKLEDGSIWLMEPGDLPDHPYTFQIWTYMENGEIDGVEGGCGLCISFVNYSVS